MDWMLGWTPPEPPHLKETLKETLARELNQVPFRVQSVQMSTCQMSGPRNGQEVLFVPQFLVFIVLII